MLPTITVDFNSIDGDCNVLARRQRASRALHVGDGVLAIEGECSCEADVVAVQGDRLTLRLDLSTWREET